MSNGNEGIQPLLRQVRIKIADVRSDQNGKLDDLLQWIDDYERREVKEIKVDTTAPPQPKLAAEQPNPIADESVTDASIVAPSLAKGKTKGKPDRE